MHHEFEPFDLLIGTHNRVNGLEEAIKEMNKLLMEVTLLAQAQGRVIQRQAKEIIHLQERSLKLRQKIDQVESQLTK